MTERSDIHKSSIFILQWSLVTPFFQYPDEYLPECRKNQRILCWKQNFCMAGSISLAFHDRSKAFSICARCRISDKHIRLLGHWYDCFLQRERNHAILSS
jgi:hypothetical protein